MKNKSKKAIVTGGAGFIGSHLVDALIKDSFDVTILDNLSTGRKSNVNKLAQFIEADIRDLKKIKPYFKNTNLVFHLAAMARIQPSIKDPANTFDNNVAGTLNVLLAARDAGVKRVIYSASSSSYGDQKTLPLHEEMTPHFKSPYALSKYIGEELCRLFSGLYGLETVSLRYFNVYGPRQLVDGAYATVIGIFIKQAKEGKPLTIVGDGNIERDFTHVKDVVRANILAGNSDKVGSGELINIGTGHNYSINEIAAMILAPNIKQPKTILATALKNRRATYIPPRPGETRKTLANNSKAQKILSWKPTVTTEEGIAELKAMAGLMLD